MLALPNPPRPKISSQAQNLPLLESKSTLSDHKSALSGQKSILSGQKSMRTTTPPPTTTTTAEAIQTIVAKALDGQRYPCPA